LIGLCVILAQAMDSLLEHRVWSLVCVSILVAAVLVAVWVMWIQPQNSTKASFMVRLERTGLHLYAVAGAYKCRGVRKMREVQFSG